MFNFFNSNNSFLADLYIHGTENSGRKTVMSRINTNHFAATPKDFVLRFGFADDPMKGGRNETHISQPELASFIKKGVQAKKTTALVFVIDACDPSSATIAHAKQLLEAQCKQYAQAPIAIIGNMQDKQSAGGCMGVAEMASQLNVHTICKGHAFQIFLASAKNDTGLQDVVPFLKTEISKLP